MTGKRVVHVIDDDAAVRRALVRLLRSEGLEVVTYETAQAALNAAPSLSAGCVLLDLQMPGMDGLELLAKVVCAQAVKQPSATTFRVGHSSSFSARRLPSSSGSCCGGARLLHLVSPHSSAHSAPRVSVISVCVWCIRRMSL